MAVESLAPKLLLAFEGAICEIYRVNLTNVPCHNRRMVMKNTLTALEVTGTIDEHHQLHLDTLLPVSGPKRVRVILLYPLNDAWDEKEWLRAAASNSAFDFLKEPEEDIYTLADGKPFDDEA